MEYQLTAQKKSDLLSVLAGSKSYFTFEMAIDRTSINTLLNAAGNTDIVTLTDREAKTIKTALQSAKVSPNATEGELDRYCELCCDFESA